MANPSAEHNSAKLPQNALSEIKKYNRGGRLSTKGVALLIKRFEKYPPQKENILSVTLWQHILKDLNGKESRYDNWGMLMEDYQVELSNLRKFRDGLRDADTEKAERFCELLVKYAGAQMFQNLG